MKHQLLRVQKFRLKPGPGQLFRSHAMVLEKAAGGKAVSYTHLDVYKRQEPGCCFLLSFGPEEAESVGALPVLPHLEVEVISGRVPGGAYIADHLALLDLLACHHTDGGTVGIQGFIGVVVAHFDVVPVPAAPGVYPVGDGDGAIGGRKDGGAARSADVGAAVVVDFPSEGIRPVAEPRGDGVALRQRPLDCLLYTSRCV